ncbi:MAG: MarR family transcriptional regulator [[Eubacterium] rectale]|nr:MarR family transcriptional regulator [Agathobacter rectalis]
MKFNFEFAEKISRTYSDECRPLCHELKLPQTAFDILMFLANNPEYKTARDIVEIRKIKANLVRRKTELVCTKKAGTVIERGRRIQQQFTANLFAGVDEEQKKQLTIVMEQLENNMDEIIRRKSHK